MKKILITAGPTREKLDPVRFLSNRSSGKMGYALAEAARDAGFEVTLVTGPTALKAPTGIRTLSSTSAKEMYDVVMQNIHQQDIFIAAAAVCDYRPVHISEHKIKKGQQKMMLELERTEDILLAVSQLQKKPFLVGFAAETDQLEQHALEKLKQKQCDILIANPVSDTEGFEQDDNTITVYFKDKTSMRFEKEDKKTLAKKIVGLL